MIKVEEKDLLHLKREELYSFLHNPSSLEQWKSCYIREHIKFCDECKKRLEEVKNRRLS